MTPYDRKFYERQQEGSLASAEIIVPLVLDFLGPIRSVVDVGCGVGGWLAVFQQHGVETIKGIDGDHVDRSLLKIPEACFQPSDLEQALPPEARYDLAVSVEVAEHLTQNRAAGFVGDLTALAPVVLFSAAIPGQEGFGHINERWPDYWAALFREQGYVPVDAIRPAIWRRPEIQVWYVQNLLLFASEAALSANERLRQARAQTDDRRLSIVHPRMLHAYVTEYNRLRKK